MPQRPNIHDSYFKQLFSRPAVVAAFFQHYLPRRGPVSLRVGLETLQAAYQADYEGRLVTAIARLAILRRPDLIAQDLAPILIYTNQLHPQLGADRLHAMVRQAMSQPGDVVMDKTFERLIQQGRQVGWTEGLSEGRQAGLAEGLQQGTEQGRLAGLQEAVAMGIESRFGAAGLRLLPQVQRIRDLAQLRRLLQELPRLQSVDQLGRFLAEGV